MLLGCLALVAGLFGCQPDLSDEEIDKIVDSMLEHPKYQAFLEDEGWVEPFANALMNNPQYLDYLATTPEEDCAMFIVMAVATSGEYTMPPQSDTERICAWYREATSPAEERDG